MSYTPGDNWCICDISGKKVLQSQTRKTWDGYRVHPDFWYPKHPQLSLRGIPERSTVRDGRPRQAEESQRQMILRQRHGGKEPSEKPKTLKPLTPGGKGPVTLRYLDGLIYMYLHEQADDSDSTFYIAEPTVHIGMLSARGMQPGRDEHASFIQVGDKRIWSKSPAAGTWIAVGDIDMSTGLRCTVAGPMGTATWWYFP